MIFVGEWLLRPSSSSLTSPSKLAISLLFWSLISSVSRTSHAQTHTWDAGQQWPNLGDGAAYLVREECQRESFEQRSAVCPIEVAMRIRRLWDGWELLLKGLVGVEGTDW